LSLLPSPFTFIPYPPFLCTVSPSWLSVWQVCCCWRKPFMYMLLALTLYLNVSSIVVDVQTLWSPFRFRNWKPHKLWCNKSMGDLLFS
jgi:hypothetical protein